MIVSQIVEGDVRGCARLLDIQQKVGLARLARRWCRILGINPDTPPPAPAPAAKDGLVAGSAPIVQANSFESRFSAVK